MAIKRVIGSFATAAEEARKASNEDVEPDVYVIEFGPEKTEFYVQHPGWFAFAAYSTAARNGLNIYSMSGRAAAYDLIKACIAAPPAPTPEEIEAMEFYLPVTQNQEWSRFSQVATSLGPNLDPGELLNIVTKVVEVYNNGFPTEPPSESPDGQSKTGNDSSERSSPPSPTSVEDVELPPTTSIPRDLAKKTPANSPKVGQKPATGKARRRPTKSTKSTG